MKKMTLQSLEIKSFVTSEADVVRGGVVQTEWCSNGDKYCSINFCNTVRLTCTVTESPNC